MSLAPALEPSLDDRWALEPACTDPRLFDAVRGGGGIPRDLDRTAVLKSLSRGPSPADDLAVMAAVVGLLAWWSRWIGALVRAALAWLMLNEFRHRTVRCADLGARRRRAQRSFA